MSLDYLKNVFKHNQQKEAVVFNDQIYDYKFLLEKTVEWAAILRANQIQSGSVVEILGDFSPESIAALLALIEHNCIIVPFSPSVKNRAELSSIAQVEIRIAFDEKQNYTINKLGNSPDIFHSILKKLKNEKKPGLILFSSGSSGKPKAIVHDFSFLLEKFEKPRTAKKMFAFLLFDHIGGLNTLLYSLYNAGAIVVTQSRNPQSICAMIEKYQVEVLPCSPSFLNLLVLSKEYKNFNLNSLELVTYGTEVMPENTLKMLNNLFPWVSFQQTYGLSEIGILRSKSKDSQSLWVRLGGEGYQTRVVDGMLEVKAKSAMLGYLNAANPFTDDGWFKTGDAVEVEGDFFRVKGRRSEIINVGGEKVFPSEVENVIQEMPGVCEVTVLGESHPLVGQIVKAFVRLNLKEDPSDFRIRLMQFCKDRLEKFKIPQKIVFTEANLSNDRFKKIRKELV